MNDPIRDAEAVLRFLNRNFGCGQDSVSAEDDIGDGRLLGDVVGEIEEAILRGPGAGIPPETADAILSMAETFGGGFDLASAEDVTDSDLTLAETAERFQASQTSRS